MIVRHNCENQMSFHYRSLWYILFFYFFFGGKVFRKFCLRRREERCKTCREFSSLSQRYQVWSKRREKDTTTSHVFLRESTAIQKPLTNNMNWSSFIVSSYTFYILQAQGQKFFISILRPILIFCTSLVHTLWNKHFIVHTVKCSFITTNSLYLL